MQSWRARRKGLGWIGIALILLNLCAPALTHALQLGRQGTTAAATHSPDWCGALLPLAAQPVASSSGDDAPDSAARPAPACGFCAQTAASWAPLPTPLGRAEAPSPAGAVQASIGGVEPEVPTFPGARPRAPPARTA
ncbi:MAG TPA: DUF2946 family protein [Burkholderiaceae bacterium]|nr:DUF2946 family protein [Burkholderiaceae bacterium]HMX10307.1 DUF2946 family protein [Burkholderiaceae bacterium]HMY99106.1 DUF2946 family protein [Burkholderiaceae bacterium]HNG78336.1 DUF2946 family protein [Burkholderiaceae bacterium]